MTPEETELYSLVSEGALHPLSEVKGKLSDWSNKKWDTTLKALTAKGILKVAKTDEGLFLSHK